MSRIGVVAALGAEARTLGTATARRRDNLTLLRDGTLLAVSGMGCEAAESAARMLADAGAASLMSWGLAGALDPSLRAGSVVLPNEIISRDGLCCPVSPEWRARFAAAISAQRPVAGGKLLTSSRALDAVAEKAAAFRETGAVAVDMESLAVAQVAGTRNLPFIAVRVIVDTAADMLPRAVVAASRNGRVRIWPLIGGLAAAPREIAPLLRLAQRYRAAIRALAAVAEVRLA